MPYRFKCSVAYHKHITGLSRGFSFPVKLMMRFSGRCPSGRLNLRSTVHVQTIVKGIQYSTLCYETDI